VQRRERVLRRGGATDFAELAVATRNGASLCGACRQVLREFGPDLPITLVDEAGRRRATSLAKLLPDSFGPSDPR
jgi:cytidine deaminase